MADQNPLAHRPRPWLALIWAILAVLTLTLAFIGWHARSAALGIHGPMRQVENAAFMTLHAFGFSESYVSPERVGDDWRLILARWIGAMLFISAAGAAGLALLRSQIAGFRASWAKGHTLIVGDHEIATALARQGVNDGLQIVHITDTTTQAQGGRNWVSLPRVAGDDLLELGRARQARRVIIAERDLGASAELALEARARSPTSATGVVAVHLDDPATAELIHHVEGGVDLFAFSEAQSAARCVLAQHPPYLLARKIAAPSVHVLIVGFNWLGQALAKDLVLTSLVSDLGRPAITVVEPDARASRDFLHRHPEFAAICDFDAVRDLEDSRLAAEAAEGVAPVCAAYICLEHSAAALAAAVALRERAARFSWVKGPIFVRLRSGGLLLAPPGAAALKPLGLYSFASLADAARESRALRDDPDAAARSVHESYDGVNAAAWATLSEEMRISNRRVVNHVPAKLASLGFDLEPWLGLPVEDRPFPPPISPSEPLYREEAEREAAARLEHRRWAADRQLNGWRWGKARDDDRKLHPDLIEFDDLPEKVRQYDYEIADWLGRYVPRADGGLRRS